MRKLVTVLPLAVLLRCGGATTLPVTVTSVSFTVLLRRGRASRARPARCRSAENPPVRTDRPGSVAGICGRRPRLWTTARSRSPGSGQLRVCEETERPPTAHARAGPRAARRGPPPPAPSPTRGAAPSRRGTARPVVVESGEDRGHVDPGPGHAGEAGGGEQIEAGDDRADRAGAAPAARPAGRGTAASRAGSTGPRITRTALLRSGNRSRPWAAPPAAGRAGAWSAGRPGRSTSGPPARRGPGDHVQPPHRCDDSPSSARSSADRAGAF